MSAVNSNSGKTVGINAVLACGAALFSDGYQNGIVGLANYVLKKIHPAEMKAGNRGVLFNSMGFFGITFGMLIAGVYVDKIGGRKSGMFIATIIVAVFATLLSLAYAPSITTQLQLMIFYRFAIGIGIGAEYPAGSVAASENTEDPDAPIAKGRQQFWFACATNGAIDWGFFISSIVPLVLYKIFGNNGLEAVWRLSFAVGIIPPVLVLYFRSNVEESYRFKHSSMRNTPVPWGLIVKRYWKQFLGISLSWFIYDFIAYPFGIYSSTIFDAIIGDDDGLTATLGWNVLANFFYIPGTIIGAIFLDRVQPKKMMIYMLIVQGIIGFIMSGLYKQLSGIVPLFAVIYGLFLSFGEAGPGNCLGLLASKNFPTAVRGQLYAACAIIGKLGALMGTWLFPVIIASFPTANAEAGPFFVGSGLAIFSAIIVYFTVKEIGPDSMAIEDAEFKQYLELNGYDTSKMGLHPVSDLEVPELNNSSSAEKVDSIEEKH